MIANMQNRELWEKRGSISALNKLYAVYHAGPHCFVVVEVIDNPRIGDTSIRSEHDTERKAITDILLRLEYRATMASGTGSFLAAVKQLAWPNDSVLQLGSAEGLRSKPLPNLPLFPGLGD